LPALRGAAVILALMMLAGPVLHHAKLVGELLRLRIVVDSSGSMELTDETMDPGRKLALAARLGLVTGRIPGEEYRIAADKLRSAGRLTSDLLEGRSPPSNWKSTLITVTDIVAGANELLGAMKREVSSNCRAENAHLRTNLCSRIMDLQASDAETESRNLIPSLKDINREIALWRADLREAFSQIAEKLLDSGDREYADAVWELTRLSRRERVCKLLLEGDEPLVQKLASAHEVELMILDADGLEPVWRARAGRLSRAGPVPVKLPLGTPGAATDLSRALTNIRYAEWNTAAESADRGDNAGATATVLISDGRDNTGDSPVHSSRILGSRGVNLYTVGVGALRRPRDIGLLNVEAPTSIYHEDRVRGKIVLKDDMEPGKPFRLEIVCEGKTLWRKTLGTDGSGKRYVHYDYPVKDAVARILADGADNSPTRAAVPLSMTVRVADTEDAEEKNNSRRVRISAITRKRKLLIVDGYPRWEWRYLKSMFERDERWDVNGIIAEGGRMPRGDAPALFPSSRERLFEYDLIFIGDVPLRVFKEWEQEAIRDFVGDRGGGILFLDGKLRRLEAYSESHMGVVLPVQWEEKGDVRINHAMRLSLTAQGKETAALLLSPDADAGAVAWEKLRPPRWTAKVRSLPGTETLVECLRGQERVPLLVSRRFGSGMALYCGTDELWRWRYGEAGKYHERFWRQIADWLMEEPYSATDNRVSIGVGDITYAPGEAASIVVKILDKNGRAAPDARARIALYNGEKRVSDIPLQSDERRPGVFHAVTGPLEAGEHKAKVEVEGIPDKDITASADFLASRPDCGEFGELTCDEDLLQQMARSARGRFFREENVDDLLDTLKPLSEGRVIETDIPLWQSYWLFLVIVSILTTEWTLRKRWGLM